MKSKKSNINILAIFIILAIIGLLIYVIIYVIMYNRNKKSNPTTNYTNTSWEWIVLVPKDPDSISIGFSPVVDKNTGNISISESYNALGLYKMNYIFGGKKILNTLNIPVECFKGITIDEFS